LNKHLNTGKKGELLALDYLKNKGYIILEKNFKSAKYEIDLIVKDTENILIFVEVKTKTSNVYGEPETAVGWKKEKNIATASEAFMEKYDDFFDIRFDIISIILDGNRSLIKHIEDAFRPKNY